MTLIALTTVPGARGATTLAAACGWTWPSPVLLAELDPSGGDLAAWFDLPEEPSLKSAVASAPAGEWPVIAQHAREITPLMQILAAPIRTREAAVVVGPDRHRALRLLRCIL